MNGLIKALKENNEDFEFYPTTKEILSVVFKDIKERHFSLLDIGVGNGSVFNILEDMIQCDSKGIPKMTITKYAFEKSQILINSMAEDIFILGTDFHQQTLIDKQVDVIFCNPPYTEYVQWAKRIIKEANSKFIYLVIPSRWTENQEILEALKLRAEDQKDFYKILGSFDFLNAERQARCKVDIVKIRLASDDYRNTLISDPFDIWFNETFKINAEKTEPSDYSEKQGAKEKIKELTKGYNLIERLAELYLKDMEKLKVTYKQIEKLDPDILGEFKINVDGIKSGLKLKIKGLKNFYWEELFDNLDKITEKLTSKSRRSMLETLRKHTTIDFSVSNAYAIVIWTIKNANKYIDQQLCDVYKGITEPKNVINYKSNKKMVEDGWRFSRSDHTHYTLDYRIVCEKYNCFSPKTYGAYEYPNGISRDIHDFLNDICTIGLNLGFNVIDKAHNFEWSPGKEKDFRYYINDKPQTFMSVRAYKKGTVHIKFNQEFMKKFNIEAARLNRWVKSPHQMAEETDLPVEEIINNYGKNLKIGKSSIKLLPQL